MSPQGEIRTAAVNGHAVVMVTEHEEDLGLNQTVLIHVEVSSVYACTKNTVLGYCVIYMYYMLVNRLFVSDCALTFFHLLKQLICSLK